MITHPTVFILGAGASIPFGFPSGRQLKEDIGVPGTDKYDCLGKLGFQKEQVDQFAGELAFSAQASVDAFLEHRAEYVDIGKASIAYRLVQAEETELLFRARENWYEYLYQGMTSDTPFEAFADNKVSFITFNYDRSLEHFLFTALENGYREPPEKVATVLGQIPVVHVHGQLGQLPWQQDNAAGCAIRDYSPDRSAGAIRAAAAGIKIISESMEKTPEFDRAQELIRQSDLVVILGFGYHPTNVRRLNIGSQHKLLDGPVAVGSRYGLTDAETGRVRHRCPGLGLGNSEHHGTLDFLRNSVDVVGAIG